jgi:hypothetical protein
LDAALIANAFDDDPGAEDGEAVPGIFRNGQIIEPVTFKIDDFPAGNSVQVMMFFDIRIKTFGSTKGFHQIDDADFGKRLERSVDGVK